MVYICNLGILAYVLYLQCWRRSDRYLYCIGISPTTGGGRETSGFLCMHQPAARTENEHGPNRCKSTYFADTISIHSFDDLTTKYADSLFIIVMNYKCRDRYRYVN